MSTNPSVLKEKLKSLWTKRSYKAKDKPKRIPKEPKEAILIY